MQDFDAAGVAVYALSYDEVDALEDFGEAHGITYPLLSDPDSEVIRSFGILNTLIAADDHPLYGIPYPGTYVVNADGVITHKFFDNNLAVRTGPEQLLRAIQGEPLLEASADVAAPEAVQVNVALDGASLAATVQRDLVARFSVPAGRHVYAEPAPQGTVAVDVVLDGNSGLVQRPVVRPASEPHTLAGSGESFGVHHDQFELRLPLTVNNAGAGAPEITVSGEIRWQSCDDEVCDLPAKQRFELTLPIAESPPVALWGKKG
ncbi:MAG: redoxin domain-containing protein, partial [bacterium]|nr:redoxin domain-containing protein [bacterium]